MGSNFCFSANLIIVVFTLTCKHSLFVRWKTVADLAMGTWSEFGCILRRNRAWSRSRVASKPDHFLNFVKLLKDYKFVTYKNAQVSF